MKDTSVPDQAVSQPAHVLQHLTQALPGLTPELQKTATYVLENPNEIGVSSIREIAVKAKVKPNSLVRMARRIGFEGYENFRKPFREQIRRGGYDYRDQAKWLQSLGSGGQPDSIYAEGAAATIANIEKLYAMNKSVDLKAAADEIVNARRTYVLGVGLVNAVATNFAYLANMAIDNVVSIPQEGSVPVDGLVRADKQDVLLAMTFKPYRREVAEAVEAARTQGVTIIAISDSPASPIFEGADYRFLISVDTPLLFISTVALSALLESLMAFVIADLDESVIASIERFHQRRYDLGIYLEESQ
ncbi:MAG: MurR/RpiR family transcriptional regulator [Acidiferrobacteraceae bacterium]|jgi:DNA-binding MurR/RpiR family transcriptional regulator|nr:MurR/RpiR family transcriptional regulator [Acidiferrobacteraceae bacterium]MBT4394365.1 MurR/RpiR family transcriptional regulator [Acidiferrobacteraceae bacterium]MBT5344824.1 MurR/RpiR family transcriptional regulator [Acidiferrobacteraceae bacterium]MBT5980728.1 MurR/RpiR family transcriptional regulator [Acidiferrobacteraceae bacterium]